MQPIQLSIPAPCHENWDNMTANQQGRFCGSCAKTVVDFSAMTDAQLISYFENLKTADVCGRVYPDQLDRPLQKTAVISPRKKTYWLWQYAAALLLFVTKGTQAKAQGEIKGKMIPRADTLKNLAEIPARMGGIRARPLPVHTTTIGAALPQYFITDENLQGIPGASVQLLPGGNFIVADSTGRINLGNNHDVESLVISAIGYKCQAIELTNISNNNIRLIAEKILMGDVRVETTAHGKTGLSGMMGGLRISGINIYQEKESENSISVKPETNIFPNPAAAGAVVNLNLNVEKTGAFKISIINAGGQMVFAKEITTQAKIILQQIKIPASWTAGVYILTVTDQAGKKISTGKLLIE